MNYDILFAIMDMKEVTFFSSISKRLMEEEKKKVIFLTFHEGGDEILKKEKIPYFSLHKIKNSMDSNKYNIQEIIDIENKFGLNFRKFIFHDMLRSVNRNETYFIPKVITYHSILDKIFKENNIGCVVQEYSGFIAPQMLYHVSRYYNVDHISIEPAMYSQRVLFVLNNLFSEIKNHKKKSYPPSEELANIIDKYVNAKTVVIPQKDKRFFQDMTFKRLLSKDNFNRLINKFHRRYVIGVGEEYDTVLWYIIYHIAKLFRRKLLSFYYSDQVKSEKYVYFPLHAILDVQLTLRSSEYFNQIALLEYIARSIPYGYRLYIKEHPADIGGTSFSGLRNIIRKYKVRLIHPRNNSFDLIKGASCILTINSKVGFEAIMQGKPVVVLGKAFYRDKGLTVDVDSLKEIPNAIKTALNNFKENSVKRNFFLRQCFHWSYKGELYDNSPENLDVFYKSLKEFIHKSGADKINNT
jgi:hypothetical protein